MITWAERIANLTKALGRKPTLGEMLDAAQVHQMTPDERNAQRQSLARAMRPAGYGMTMHEISARLSEINRHLDHAMVSGSAWNCLNEERNELAVALQRLT